MEFHTLTSFLDFGACGWRRVAMRFALKWCDFLIPDVTFVKWRGHAVMWLSGAWCDLGRALVVTYKRNVRRTQLNPTPPEWNGNPCYAFGKNREKLGGSGHLWQFIPLNSFIPIRSCQLIHFNFCMPIHSFQTLHFNSFMSSHSFQILHPIDPVRLFGAK